MDHAAGRDRNDVVIAAAPVGDLRTASAAAPLASSESTSRRSWSRSGRRCACAPRGFCRGTAARWSARTTGRPWYSRTSGATGSATADWRRQRRRLGQHRQSGCARSWLRCRRRQLLLPEHAIQVVIDRIHAARGTAHEGQGFESLVRNDVRQQERLGQPF